MAAAKAENTLVGHMVDVFSNMMSVRFFTGKKVEKDHLNYPLAHMIQTESEFLMLMLVIYAIAGLGFLIST